MFAGVFDSSDLCGSGKVNCPSKGSVVLWLEVVQAIANYVFENVDENQKLVEKFVNKYYDKEQAYKYLYGHPSPFHTCIEQALQQTKKT